MERKKEIVWSVSARDDLQTIYDYYAHFSAVAANHLIDRLFDTVTVLEKPGNENIGQFDEYNHDYRRLVVGNYKIFYQVFEETILIIRVFDTRQDPEKSNK